MTDAQLIKLTKIFINLKQDLNQAVTQATEQAIKQFHQILYASPLKTVVDVDDEPKASANQARMLYAVSQQHGLTKQELSDILAGFGVFSGWTPDLPVKFVGDCKKHIEDLAAFKAKQNEEEEVSG